MAANLNEAQLKERPPTEVSIKWGESLSGVPLRDDAKVVRVVEKVVVQGKVSTTKCLYQLDLLLSDEITWE